MIAFVATERGEGGAILVFVGGGMDGWMENLWKGIGGWMGAEGGGLGCEVR